jgi:hypothetical protein
MTGSEVAMNKGDQTLAETALDRLSDVGTVRGVCMGRGGKVLINRFPFSDWRLLNLCGEVELVLDNFSKRGRSVERMVFGFDGGHLVLLVDGDVRLMIMHLIPDEADFVAKAGQAFLKDHGGAIADMEPMAIEAEVEAEAPGPEADVTKIVEDEKGGAKEPVAAAARNAQPSERENPHPVVTKPDIPELPLESSPPVEGSGFRELLEASRKQKIDDAVLATCSDEEPADDNDGSCDEDRSLAAWAAEHLDLPEDGSSLLLPKQTASSSRHHPAGRPVVGAVRVQPVRLAAQQPQSTLPPPKKPRVRRSKETVEGG